MNRNGRNNKNYPVLVAVVAFLLFVLSLGNNFLNVDSEQLLATEQAEQAAEQELSLSERIEQEQLQIQTTQITEKETVEHPESQPQSISETVVQTVTEANSETAYQFRKARYLTEHFQKHGEEFPYDTEEDYLQGANDVIKNPEALHKLEAEDGDDVYYVEDTNEFVVVSTDGYIRTYFKATLDYYNRQ
ncbi:MAG: hypothetical protein HFH74_11675 [Lachnospiraceae bacterium]|jgi:pyocin large subunit-like protein|nr:hypothetical protein [Lachnospiraceae bacterium]